MTALDTYLIAMATDDRCRELIDIAMGGRSFSSDDCDVLRGLVTRVCQQDPQVVPDDGAFDDMQESLEHAIEAINWEVSTQIDRIIERCKQLAREARRASR